MGLAGKKLNDLGKKGLVKFNLFQLVSHVICWIVFANVLDVLFYSEPFNKVLVQSLGATLINVITTAIIGSILCVAYSATKIKAGSLSKE